LTLSDGVSTLRTSVVEAHEKHSLTASPAVMAVSLILVALISPLG
jgi:hypothetical protein